MVHRSFGQRSLLFRLLEVMVVLSHLLVPCFKALSVCLYERRKAQLICDVFNENGLVKGCLILRGVECLRKHKLLKLVGVNFVIVITCATMDYSVISSLLALLFHILSLIEFK